MKNLLFKRENTIKGNEFKIAKKRVTAAHPLADLHLHEVFPWLSCFERKKTEEEIALRSADGQRINTEPGEIDMKTFSPAGTQDLMRIKSLNESDMQHDPANLKQTVNRSAGNLS